MLLRPSGRGVLVHNRKSASVRCAADSPLEQFAAQRAAMLQERQEEHVKRAYEDKLRVASDMTHLLDKNMWRSLCPDLSIEDDASSATLAAQQRAPHAAGAPAAGAAAAQLELLLNRGFCGVEGIDWEALVSPAMPYIFYLPIYLPMYLPIYVCLCACRCVFVCEFLWPLQALKTLWRQGVDFGAMARAMDALKAAGWPPVFVFMYDETWRVLETLFDVTAPLLQDDELVLRSCVLLGADGKLHAPLLVSQLCVHAHSHTYVCTMQVLEASVYAWALEKPELRADAPGEMVGGNFGVPHRDAAYAVSHTAEGLPNILGLWIPVVDVTTENGCMFVVPRERDPMFTDDAHRLHRAPEKMPNFPHAHVRPLAANAGTVLAWHHNTIHWGSSCSPYAEQPRKSIAMSFRLREAWRPWTDKDAASYWRRPLSRAEVAAGSAAPIRLCVSSSGRERALATEAGTPGALA